MNQVIEILRKIDQPYLIIGTTALRLHGFPFEQHDIDIWLNPNLELTKWDALVDRVSDSVSRVWTRGHDNGRGGINHNTRLNCQPILDIMHHIDCYPAKTFEKVLARALPSNLGMVAPADVVFRMKRKANRGKDFRQLIRAIQWITRP